jgi:glyoxylase-like metal-dependent hydrolase (beta-lactamase superfamily II)
MPDIVIDESMPLHDYGVDARVLTTPGHTPGSIPVLADSGELIAGDLIAGPFLGAVRHRPANPRFRHDRTLNLASLDAVLALDPAVGVRRPWGAAGAVAPTTLGKKRTPQTRSSANNVNLTADQSEKSPWS